MNSFFEEVRRRKVYRVVAAYIVGAGFIIQTGAVIFPTLQLPSWSLRLVIVAVLAGFPVALVFGCIFDIAARSAERATGGPGNFACRPRTLVLLAASGLAASLAAGFWLLPHVGVRKIDKSIAVLPFANFSDEKENAYFADGMQDDILTNLARMGDLKVISRTSVMGYGSGKQNVREIAKALGVSTVLEGSVRRAGNRVRVTVQLIDALNDEHLWANDYTRDLTDVFAIQSELAQEIAGALRVKLSPSEKARMERKPTENGEAYMLYVEAHNIFTRPDRNSQNLNRAAQLYERAIALDPQFALAYAQLSRLHSWTYHALEPVPARLEKARAAASEALRLQSDLPEGHLALGYYYYHGVRDYEKATAEFETAKNGLPNEPEIFLSIGAIQRRQGKWAESSANFERGISLNPKDPIILENLATNQLALKNYGAASAILEKAAKLAPASFDIMGMRARLALEWKGSIDEMEKALANPPENADHDGAVTLARYNLRLFQRRFDEALQILDGYPRRVLYGETSAPLLKEFLAAHIYRLMNDEEKARAAYEASRAAAEHAVAESPLTGARHSLLGLVYAGLGRKEEAIREGRRGAELLAQDALDGPTLARALARIYAMTGEPANAISILEKLLKIPSGVTEAELRVDPTWDPLRSEPGFQALLK
jgi:TolB-like protein/Flp pilus assembly protein TadD